MAGFRNLNEDEVGVTSLLDPAFRCLDCVIGYLNFSAAAPTPRSS
jgi:hypothetical protein